MGDGQPLKDPQKIHQIIVNHQNENKPIRFIEFSKIRPGKYYKLGGLGPSNIGSESWIRAKERIQKVDNYVNSVQ